MRTFLIIISLFLNTTLTQAADINAIIAVAANGNNQSSAITSTTKASFFLLFNSEGNFLKAVANNSQGDAGEAAANLAKQGTTILIANGFDRASLEAISAQDVIPMKKTGSINKAVQSLVVCEEPEKK
jgi:predicted Fe-Mo cluster-binding NifX family protein